MFISALFTTVKRWKKPKGPSIEDKRNVSYTYNGILFWHKMKF